MSPMLYVLLAAGARACSSAGCGGAGDVAPADDRLANELRQQLGQRESELNPIARRN